MEKSRKSTELKEIVTRSALRVAAGSVYFRRGEEYFDLDTVRALRERDGILRATVSGRRAYKTSLWIEGGTLVGQCSCPLGQEGQFCKHLVATGLTYLEQERSPRETGKNSGKPICSEGVESWLGQLPTEELVEVIMEHANHDDDFYTMLELKVAAASDTPIISEMRRVIHQTIGIDDFVSWRETHDYMYGVNRIVEQLRDMVDSRHAAEVVELIEYALEVWEDAIQNIDDSDGCMGMLREELHELHLKVCKKVKPDSTALAERLFRRATESGWDMFPSAYENYHGILGKKGRARYRELAEAAWKRLPRFGREEKDPHRCGRSSRLRDMMLAFAEEDGDFDRVIDILSQDLSHPYNFLVIAERCRKARKYRLACEWAEKGLQTFPDKPDSRLRDFLADEYLRTKRPDEAIAMIWANFEERPALKTYRQVAAYAKKITQWPHWREKALAHVRSEIKPTKTGQHHQHGERITHRFPSRWVPSSSDHSLLVEILLWEKKSEDAWAEAQKGGCSGTLWLELARQREKEHPEDALEIYRRQVIPLVKQTNNYCYEQAVGYLEKVYSLMIRLDKEKEFQRYLVDLKSEYRRKRNFIKYVERKRWGK